MRPSASSTRAMARRIALPTATRARSPVSANVRLRPPEPGGGADLGHDLVPLRTQFAGAAVVPHRLQLLQVGADVLEPAQVPLNRGPVEDRLR